MLRVGLITEHDPLASRLPGFRLNSSGKQAVKGVDYPGARQLRRHEFTRRSLA
jgi:hypothetical protein